MANRIAIVIEKNLSPGQIGNVTALLMGQIAINSPGLYFENGVKDLDGSLHAGIQFSTIILKAGSGQLVNLVTKIKTEQPRVEMVVFSRIGQNLHNRFDEYAAQLQMTSTVNSELVGVGLAGEDAVVRALTKKFTLVD